jgi:hypothetical protein
VGQDGILRPIVNRPSCSEVKRSGRPIDNRPQDFILPHKTAVFQVNESENLRLTQPREIFDTGLSERIKRDARLVCNATSIRKAI